MRRLRYFFAGTAMAVFILMGAWTVRSSDVASDRVAKPLMPAKVRSAVAIPVSSRQFDVVCHITRQFDLTEPVREPARPYRPPVARDYVSRTIVDLDRKQACFADICGVDKRELIAAVTP